MGIQVVWDSDSKRSLRFVYTGRWTWDDFFVARTQADALMSSVSYKVDVIVDVRDSDALPPGVLFKMREIIRRGTHTNEGITVIVGASTLIRSIYDTFSKVYGRFTVGLPISFAPTIDDAHKLIFDQRNSH